MCRLRTDGDPAGNRTQVPGAVRQQCLRAGTVKLDCGVFYFYLEGRQNLGLISLPKDSFSNTAALPLGASALIMGFNGEGGI